ncbi:MAG TPA: hypothetical protein VGN04_09060 [Herbaspirillum sp.]|jgi:hypothetical protein
MSSDTPSALSKAPYAPREGVFIPRKQVQKMRRARDLLDDARRHARGMLKQARQQAAAIRREAFAAGYEDGVLASASQVLAHFDAAQAQALRLRGELKQYAGDLLGATLVHPDTVLAVLDECLQGLAGPLDRRIRIVLPESMRGARARLNAMLAQAGRNAVEVGYGEDARLVVLAGEQVFEFDPPESIAQGQERLMTRFSDLADACRGLGDDAMQQLRLAFEQRFDGKGPAGKAGRAANEAGASDDIDDLDGLDDDLDDPGTDDDMDGLDKPDALDELDELGELGELDDAFFDDADEEETARI